MFKNMGSLVFVIFQAVVTFILHIRNCETLEFFKKLVNAQKMFQVCQVII